ncbi:sporulation protein rmd1 [Elasticomyces elasticus]|nr:sporulation protein rmd1 [Elasticomyces elasticus]KAK3650872.1 sporulation protein rmd1 [Elasticomyces elasticus]KAK4903922.1 sporulation protein rmd1 [Elasticomyces elasticus]KAK5738290.1 sporulation protein rmd1 [Elasticomyces elasticus]
MASSSSDRTPLLPPKPTRSVTFNPQISSSSPPKRRPEFTTNKSFGTGRDGSQPMLSALNSKLRRRNSSGAPLQYQGASPASKIGPQRTTRTAQKLKLLPNPENEEEDEESGREVYSQFTRIKDPTARRDAARLGKDDRAKLPRVTAYCTASSYKMDDLMRFLKGRMKTKAAAPKLFDECLYSPYRYKHEGSGRRRSSGAMDEEESRDAIIEVRSEPVRRFSDSAIEVEENAERRREDLIDFQDQPAMEGDPSTTHHPFISVDDSGLDVSSSLANPSTTSLPLQHDPDLRPETPDFDTSVHIPEIFLFEYGVVVLWGFTLAEETRFLKEIAKFEVESLGKDEIQTEEFNFYYTREYQARIYNDFISLKKKRDYMTKLAISHALAQSTKTSLYEESLDTTITTTSSIPAMIASTGRIQLTRKQINMQIGELFILRINIHLQGSVLDAPELMWAEPQLEPVYQAVRSYLEMDQRVELMQERVSVVGDLLAVLKDQLSHTHGEYLEWIVIVLIAAEIVVAGINILVDLYAGVD